MTPDPLTRTTSLAAQVSRAVLWNTIFIPLRALSEVVATLIKLNLLSPASYGLLALVSGATSLLGSWIDLGTTRALPKFIPEVSRAGGRQAVSRLLRSVFGMQLLALLVITVGLFAFNTTYLSALITKIGEDTRLSLLDQQTLTGFVTQSGLVLILTIAALLFLGAAYDMFMAYLSSFFRQRAWNSVDLAARLLPPALAAIAILATRGLPEPQRAAILGVLAAMVIAPFIATILAGSQVVRNFRTQAAAPETPTIVGERLPLLPAGFARYSAVSLLMTLTDILAGKSFGIFLAKDIGDVAVLWAGASVVGMVLGYLYTPMVGVQVPLFTRVRAGEGGTLQGAYQSLIRLQVLLLIPGGVGLMLLAEPVLAVIAPQYRTAAPIVWILVPCLFLECLLTTAHNALIVHEKLRVVIFSRLLTFSIVPLVLVLQPQLGILGVALAFGLARLLAGASATLGGARVLGLRWPVTFTLRVLLAGGILGLFVFGAAHVLPALPDHASIAARMREAALLACVGVAGGILFFGSLRLLGGLDPTDREQLARMKLPLKRWILRIL